MTIFKIHHMYHHIMIPKILCCFFLALGILTGVANAKQGKCDYKLSNISGPTSELIEPVKGKSMKYKVHATAIATYTHKDGTTVSEIVNLDQGATVVVDASEEQPWHDRAKEKATLLLYQKALSRRMELCRDNGCSKQ